MADRLEPLDYAERWLADGFRVLDTPGGFLLLEVEMMRARTLIERLRAAGVPATYTHVIVRAAALALARHPELHLLVAGHRRLRPERVDIGLSVSGSSFYAPVMVLEDAARKPLPALSAEIARRAPEVRDKAERDLASMRRLGWIIPFGWLRRALLRLFFGFPRFRRKLAGTFQVTSVHTLDVATPFQFTAAAALGVGRVRDRVVAVDGQPAVRPTAILSVAIDHTAWDGVRTALFMNELRAILEEGQLDDEAPAAPR
jgi:pyruvate dehydrogenase E2 component (dihydrolipoamide acetyltransferase)